MDAIEYLTGQHREIDQLFEEVAGAEPDDKLRLFETLADRIAIHAAVEERVFYPAVMTAGTEELLQGSVQEHLEHKRLLAVLMEAEEDEALFDSVMRELASAVRDHVHAEEQELFPAVRALFDDPTLDQLCEAMQEVAADLDREGTPRESLPLGTDRPAPL